MGYRRDSEAALRWKKWQHDQEDLRVLAGLPTEIMQTEDAWWDYLNHEINVPAYDYKHYSPLSPQQTALIRLVLSWPGGAETSLGVAFLALERRNEARQAASDD